jgi:hypothetical protein
MIIGEKILTDKATKTLPLIGKGDYNETREKSRSLVNQESCLLFLLSVASPDKI